MKGTGGRLADSGEGWLAARMSASRPCCAAVAEINADLACAWAPHSRYTQGEALRAELERTFAVAFDDSVKVGAMIEVPAAALSLPMFVKKLDFLSIGTNDLIQYTLAIDRADHEVAHLYSDTHPAILQLLDMTVTAADRAGIPVAICGGMAADIKLTRLLVAMGFRELSMPAAILPEIKQEVLRMDASALQASTKKILRTYEPKLIQELLNSMRQQHFSSN